uniref:Uncharacterized protein n=1 Tax=Zea mays TaxID=4577 RepID=B6UC55_MAIZE|nr:hypothetical protein [Zea mays]
MRIVSPFSSSSMNGFWRISVSVVKVLDTHNTTLVQVTSLDG